MNNLLLGWMAFINAYGIFFCLFLMGVLVYFLVVAGIAFWAYIVVATWKNLVAIEQQNLWD